MLLELFEKTLRRNESPGPLQEIREGRNTDGGEADEDPGMIAIVIRDVKDMRVCLQQHLAVQEFRA